MQEKTFKVRIKEQEYKAKVDFERPFEINFVNGGKGDKGDAATITIGKTTTLPPEESATVTNSGTKSDAILNFGIPRGFKGDKGDKGEAGAGIASVHMNADYTLTITYTNGTSYTTPSIRGETGATGNDGFSPIATVTKSGDTATISITDAEGTTTAEITDGTDGTNGTDGFSPIATVTKSGDTATISITDAEGTTTATVTDGVTPTVDTTLSSSSTNPVQNDVITNALDGKQATLNTGDVTTTLIADNAITNGKIDWASVGFRFYSGSIGSGATVTLNNVSGTNAFINAGRTVSGGFDQFFVDSAGEAYHIVGTNKFVVTVSTTNKTISIKNNLAVSAGYLVICQAG